MFRSEWQTKQTNHEIKIYFFLVSSSFAHATQKSEWKKRFSPLKGSAACTSSYTKRQKKKEKKKEGYYRVPLGRQIKRLLNVNVEFACLSTHKTKKKRKKYTRYRGTPRR